MDGTQANILANLVRVGVVSAVDMGRKKARVFFPDRDNLVSGWLPVLQRSGEGVAVAPDGGHTHTIRDTYSGGGSASAAPAHDHDGSKVTAWLPGVGATVLVLYLPVFNADGFILGAI
jgi:hypothetical protein